MELKDALRIAEECQTGGGHFDAQTLTRAIQAILADGTCPQKLIGLVGSLYMVTAAAVEGTSSEERNAA